MNPPAPILHRPSSVVASGHPRSTGITRRGSRVPLRGVIALTAAEYCRVRRYRQRRISAGAPRRPHDHLLTTTWDETLSSHRPPRRRPARAGILEVHSDEDEALHFAAAGCCTVRTAPASRPPYGSRHPTSTSHQRRGLKTGLLTSSDARRQRRDRTARVISGQSSGASTRTRPVVSSCTPRDAAAAPTAAPIGPRNAGSRRLGGRGSTSRSPRTGPARGRRTARRARFRGVSRLVDATNGTFVHSEWTKVPFVA
ncbi:hypothetical protein SAMN05443637_102407 [Pseudonocardia thermophila]|uniref:Uncharacterized protein n=1 Tax=Pseudonocardia thermophila TaxID=1848 RepID=A0A1M6PR16_PSETH|nr:hypothetical protein SAMN05443637_102407 [Pseudonocardia thermophila]